MSMYTNKSILVIGGTGTIGRKLVNVLLEHQPKVIRIFSRDEFKQFELQQELSEHNNLRFLIGDVRDHDRVLRAMEDIDYVFHLAAMKHVPACEYNPFEAVQTNVVGTQNVIQAALTAGVKKVLFTSTDKAISPTNVYGATKLTAERLISAAVTQKGPKPTVFSSVRFGNVMGSRGSVIPLFKKQILEQRRITVTDMSMTRYMMTPTQAVELILQANNAAQGGEVFVLKMPLVGLKDLVEVVIEEIAKRYHITDKIEIKEIGMRPGEKHYEELMTADETLNALETPEMFVIPPAFGDRQLSEYKAGSASELSLYLNAEIIDKEILRDWLVVDRILWDASEEKMAHSLW